MTSSFSQLGLPDDLVAALATGGITKPFPIQEATIPSGLAGRDVCGKAPTGSGKTLAFGLPLLANVDQATGKRPRALVLAPTRELAAQIKDDLTPLARAVHRRIAVIHGGVGYGPQKGALRKGVDVLVATPGRLEDLIEQGSVDLREVAIVVVDEADRMADMGFLPAVRRILDATSSRRQTLLFSATLDGDVAVLIDRYQRDPARYEAKNTKETVEVKHHFWLVEHQDRVQHTADVVGAMGRSIVFTRTRHGADRLARQLDKAGVGAVAMHGGRSQGQRNRAMQAFSTGRAQALVATDVAARGIHIDAVEVVVHFDPAADEKDFVHRSGRTGRAGAEGIVVSLVTNQHRKSITRIQRSLNMNEPIGRPRIEDLQGTRARPKATPPVERPVPEPKPGHRPKSQPMPRRDPRGSGNSITKLFVGNLPWDTTADDLDRLFSPHGEVTGSSIATKRGRSKGYGFVEMSGDSARSAIETLHATRFDGREMVVRAAR